MLIYYKFIYYKDGSYMKTGFLFVNTVFQFSLISKMNILFVVAPVPVLRIIF